MEDLRKMRAGGSSQPYASNGSIGKSMSYSAGSGISQVSKMQHNQMFPTNVNGLMAHQVNHDVGDLTQGLRGMQLQSPAFGGSTRPNPQISTPPSVTGNVQLNGSMPFVYGNQLMFTDNQYVNGHGQTGIPTPPGAGYASSGYYGYAPPYTNYSPSWTTSRVPSGEVPSLITPRRGSSSSNENDLPSTPFTQYTGYGNGVAVLDHSPNSFGAWSTPSPSQPRFGLPKPGPVAYIPLSLQILCQQDPSIPRAVPAPYSPQKPLDQRLVNRHGITNVYVRGLQPNTTDDMLLQYAVRFGEIESHKAIIDHETKKCKGFGFVKYYSFPDAENCIRGFTFCGYETSFARESFYAQLKKLSEPHNTNLYISNLPKNLNEHELASIFSGFNVLSARILRNADGSGRGVGFARFETREICEAVINDFNNTPLARADSGEHLIQIRYADTPEQKALKQSTTAARQYRTAEYESQIQGPATNANQFMSHYKSDNDFEQYMSGVAGVPPVGDGRSSTTRLTNAGYLLGVAASTESQKGSNATRAGEDVKSYSPTGSEDRTITTSIQALNGHEKS